MGAWVFRGTSGTGAFALWTAKIRCQNTAGFQTTPAFVLGESHGADHLGPDQSIPGATQLKAHQCLFGSWGATRPWGGDTREDVTASHGVPPLAPRLFLFPGGARVRRVPPGAKNTMTV